MQHDTEGQLLAKAQHVRLEALEALQDAHMLRDADSNSRLRAGLRAKKRSATLREEEGRAKGLSFPLVDFSAEDDAQVQFAKFKKHRAAPPARIGAAHSILGLTEEGGGESSSKSIGSSANHRRVLAGAIRKLNASGAADFVFANSGAPAVCVWGEGTAARSPATAAATHADGVIAGNRRSAQRKDGGVVATAAPQSEPKVQSNATVMATLAQYDSD